jgi:hypothetical protein
MITTIRTARMRNGLLRNTSSKYGGTSYVMVSPWAWMFAAVAGKVRLKDNVSKKPVSWDSM